MHHDFAKLIIENQGRLRYIARRYSGEDEFEDMYQEILLQLWRSFASFSGESKRETWVYKVALNTAFTFVRVAIKHREGQQTIVDYSTGDTQPAQDNCQAEILNNFMNQLTDTDASVLMMYLDDFNSDEIADVTGLSSNAVRSRIKRIKHEFENSYIGE
jgi:RNA polymerase sigma-70 factor, ECF subfamily